MVRRGRPKQGLLERISGRKTGIWKRTPKRTPKGCWRGVEGLISSVILA